MSKEKQQIIDDPREKHTLIGKLPYLLSDHYNGGVQYERSAIIAEIAE